MLRQICFTSFALFAAVSVQASFTINNIVGSGFGNYLQSDGATLVNADYQLQYGVFDIDSYNALPDNLKTNFSSVSSLLSTDATQTKDFDASGGIFTTDQFGSPFEPMAGDPTPTTGDQIYILVYNTLNTDEFGLFTSTAWLVPNTDIGDATLAPTELQSTGTALVGSISGENGILANTVPEPSTYALLAGVMTLGLVAYRRRQKA
ncbi:PEP-CTERM sorting domain-containing protein [Cerasicoccus frondis]|uniref:PEP-CTERM sorting domain-containing protein n=1 Tax=Cerasicoccus frondis TaxID=490090 RepID=UPI002852B0E6|nr:PEP-CTERM sorting domain-containing protein [Cerasicoccus frondis]